MDASLETPSPTQSASRHDPPATPSDRELGSSSVYRQPTDLGNLLVSNESAGRGTSLWARASRGKRMVRSSYSLYTGTCQLLLDERRRRAPAVPEVAVYAQLQGREDLLCLSGSVGAGQRPVVTLDPAGRHLLGCALRREGFPASTAVLRRVSLYNNAAAQLSLVLHIYSTRVGGRRQQQQRQQQEGGAAAEADDEEEEDGEKGDGATAAAGLGGAAAEEDAVSAAADAVMVSVDEEGAVDAAADAAVVSTAVALPVVVSSLGGAVVADGGSEDEVTVRGAGGGLMVVAVGDSPAVDSRCPDSAGVHDTELTLSLSLAPAPAPAPCRGGQAQLDDAAAAAAAADGLVALSSASADLAPPPCGGVGSSFHTIDRERLECILAAVNRAGLLRDFELPAGDASGSSSSSSSSRARRSLSWQQPQQPQRQEKRALLLVPDIMKGGLGIVCANMDNPRVDMRVLPPGPTADDWARYWMRRQDSTAVTASSGSGSGSRGAGALQSAPAAASAAQRTSAHAAALGPAAARSHVALEQLRDRHKALQDQLAAATRRARVAWGVAQLTPCLQLLRGPLLSSKGAPGALSEALQAAEAALRSAQLDEEQLEAAARQSPDVAATKLALAEVARQMYELSQHL